MKLTTVDITNSVIDEVTFTVGDTNVKVSSYNPHGFYRISLEKGRLPKELQGDYTSRLMAENDVKRYFEQKVRNPLVSNEKVI